MKPKEVIVAAQIRELEVQQSARRTSELCEQEELERYAKLQRSARNNIELGAQRRQNMNNQSTQRLGHLSLVHPEYPDIVA
jgi:hypothetical protein